MFLKVGVENVKPLCVCVCVCVYNLIFNYFVQVLVFFFFFFFWVKGDLGIGLEPGLTIFFGKDPMSSHKQCYLFM